VLLGGYVTLAATTERIFELLKARDGEANKYVDKYFDAWVDLLRIEREGDIVSMEDEPLIDS
jgi:hypothetical protein